MAEKILVVDDERGIRYSLKRMFEERGFKVSEAKNGKEAIEIVKKGEIDLALMDIKMPGINGLEVLKEMRIINPKLLVIIMTAYGTTQTAIEAMRFGAFDYILKPFDIPQIWRLVKKGLWINKLMREAVTYEPEKRQPDVECIIGNSPKMQEVYKLIGQVAEKDITVLLRGESGTGKELVARAIYHHSKRSERTFLPVNCAAIPETLLESELFGYNKGAFTDAHSDRIGKFEQCSGGTAFLDEIGDMSLATQAKILRFLQDGEITRLGSNESIKVDMRLIVATNKDLEKAMKEGRFREDLYYRLNVVTINLPPLWQRKEDISQLTRYFLNKFNRELDKDIVDINPEAMEKLVRYHWPGNVRQLENVIRRACILCKGAYILPGELSLDLREATQVKREKKRDEEGLEKLLDDLYTKIATIPQENREDIIPFIEKALIIRTLKETNGNQSQAAQILGINRNTLRNKIEKYGIKISKRVEI